MTSKSRDLTENTQPLFSEENIEAPEPQSKQLVNSDNTPTSTQTSQKLSSIMLSDENKELTTLKISEKTRQHATIARVALLQLEKAGLVKRFKVLSKDRTTHIETRVVFDPKIWTSELVLSDEVDNS